MLMQNLIAAIACIFTPVTDYSPTDTVELYVIQQDYHTGISLKTADVNLKEWPECAEFISYTWVDVGCGDREFYQSPDNNPLVVVKALAAPTPSVMRIEGYAKHPLTYLSGCPLAKIALSRQQFDKLCAVFHDTYKRDRDGKIEEASGSYQYRFYSARGSYHIMNTCNTWVARAFRKAGLDVQVLGVITASQLFRALKPYSKPTTQPHGITTHKLKVGKANRSAASSTELTTYHESPIWQTQFREYSLRKGRNF